MESVRKAIWWARDYAWAALVWVSVLFAPESPDRYATGSGRPILVIPGVYEDWRFMRPLIVPLHRRGYAVHAIPELERNRAPIAEGASAVRALLVERDLRDVVVVGHSKGGLIGQLALRDDTEGRIAALVTICAPFHGSSRSRLLPLRSLRPLVPGHPSLVGLGLENAMNARITSICSSFDEHVPEGSELPGADNVHLAVSGHFRPIGHPDTLAEILRVLAT